jgi:hypothetical protein
MLALAVAAISGLELATTNEVEFLNYPESVRGMDLFEESGLSVADPLTETVIVRGDSATVDDPVFREAIEQTTSDLRALTGLVDAGSVTNKVVDAGAPQAERLISEDRRTPLIIVAVFAGSVAGRLAFQQMGFGLAMAVLLDATIVRSVLVPATMTLLGDRNWYLPSWLSWLSDVRIEGDRAPLAPLLLPVETPVADGVKKCYPRPVPCPIRTDHAHPREAV